MSRIGVLPIKVPSEVKVQIEGRDVQVEGPQGKLQWQLPERTQVAMEDGQLIVRRDGNDPEARSMHGLCRSILYNLVTGVGQGFTKRLEIQGVGFKASVQGNQLNLNIGFSKPKVYPVPDQIKVTVEENTKIVIQGPSKEVVGRVASEVRSYYPVEPYKGKGIRYSDERVIRKEGKTVQ